jgi:hypothetical protein
VTGVQTCALPICPNALREEVRVEGRGRGHGEYLAVVRVHGDEDAALRGSALEVLLGRELHVEVDGRDEVLPGLRLDDGQLTLDAPAAVHLDLAVAVAPP